MGIASIKKELTDEEKLSSLLSKYDLEGDVSTEKILEVGELIFKRFGEPSVEAVLQDFKNLFAKLGKGNIEKTIQDIFSGIIKRGLTLQHIKGIPDDLITATYCIASELFKRNEIIEARKYFRWLVLHNPYRKEFIFGLAVCGQRLLCYQEAVNLYSICLVTNPKDPKVLLPLAACQYALKNYEIAFNGFKHTLAAAEGKPEFIKEKLQAQRCLESLIKSGRN